MVYHHNVDDQPKPMLRSIRINAIDDAIDGRRGVPLNDDITTSQSHQPAAQFAIHFSSSHEEFEELLRQEKATNANNHAVAHADADTTGRVRQQQSAIHFKSHEEFEKIIREDQNQHKHKHDIQDDARDEDGEGSAVLSNEVPPDQESASNNVQDVSRLGPNSNHEATRFDYVPTNGSPPEDEVVVTTTTSSYAFTASQRPPRLGAPNTATDPTTLTHSRTIILGIFYSAGFLLLALVVTSSFKLQRKRTRRGSTNHKDRQKS